jgi:hypothetical protein
LIQRHASASVAKVSVIFSGSLPSNLLQHGVINVAIKHGVHCGGLGKVSEALAGGHFA